MRRDVGIAKPLAGDTNQFQLGDVVVVHALPAASRNGRRGSTVQGPDRDGRYKIRLQSGRTLRLPRENVALATAPEAVAALALPRRVTKPGAAVEWCLPPLHELFDPVALEDVVPQPVGAAVVLERPLGRVSVLAPDAEDGPQSRGNSEESEVEVQVGPWDACDSSVASSALDQEQLAQAIAAVCVTPSPPS